MKEDLLKTGELKDDVQISMNAKNEISLSKPAKPIAERTHFVPKESDIISDENIP